MAERTGAPEGVVVTLDGQVHNPRAPLLHADDLAAVRGDGIFETLLIRHGRPCLLESHLARLAHSARSVCSRGFRTELTSMSLRMQARLEQGRAGSSDSAKTSSS